MCGIIAIAGKKVSGIENSVIEEMLSCLSKRGPDEKAYVKLDNVILGQTRLSIVDIGGGKQPMKDSEHPLTLVFNGEIYDYKETRRKLEKHGHIFKTQSDTEVILKAYAQYGRKCVDHLDGMFAFALWDEAQQELFIARDRFGKKPFYYTFIDNTFFGASEIKSIFKTGLAKGNIDPQAINDYLRLLYIPPWKTIYSNIHTLPPASAGIVKNGNIETWKYWQLDKKTLTISYDDAKKEIKKLFNDAVRKRMIADVEIGSLLSGGVDSTIVTAYAAQYSNQPIKTFAVGFGIHKNELPYALEASKKIQTDHHTLVTEKVDINELKKVIAYFDEPHADSSNFPQHLVSKLASSKVKVALSGDGADELLMGYGWYQKHWHTPFLKRLLSNPFSSYKKVTEVFSKSERKLLLKKKVHELDEVEKSILDKKRNPFDKINTYDLSVYLPGQLLTKVDRTSMMHSLEIRSPFLDTKLAEFVYNLPIEYKISKTENKIILKDILAETFPKEFVYRRKQGFGAPMHDWLQDPDLQEEIVKITKDDKHPIYTHLNKEVLKKILEKKEYDKYSIQKVWSIICLAFWFELHQQDYE